MPHPRVTHARRSPLAALSLFVALTACNVSSAGPPTGTTFDWGTYTSNEQPPKEYYDPRFEDTAGNKAKMTSAQGVSQPAGLEGGRLEGR
jgi:hypothetical protein